jgi:hypothetical protein
MGDASNESGRVGTVQVPGPGIEDAGEACLGCGARPFLTPPILREPL